MGSDEPVERPVRVPVGDLAFLGDLVVPADVRGVVLFAHGSGSSRHSPRNRRVAAGLNAAGCATLLVDLLTETEEEVDLVTRELRFDIGLLASRLVACADWVAEAVDVPVVLFGASTGAAAALVAAAERPGLVRGVVSRGGRPDLTGSALEHVTAPVLLLVGGADTEVLELNRQAALRLSEEVAVEVVPGATHLFEEPGALDAVIDLTVSALDRWL